MKFIFRYRGSAPVPPQDIERLHSDAGLQILDASSPKLLLIETAEEQIAQLQTDLPQWTISVEQSIPLPDPRHRLRKDDPDSRQEE